MKDHPDDNILTIVSRYGSMLTYHGVVFGGSLGSTHMHLQHSQIIIYHHQLQLEGA